MSIKIRIPLGYMQGDTDFYQLTQNLVEVNGKTVGECLDDLIEQFPGMKKQLFTNSGNLIENVLISVNGESPYPKELVKPVKDGDELIVVFMIAGG